MKWGEGIETSKWRKRDIELENLESRVSDTAF